MGQVVELGGAGHVGVEGVRGDQEPEVPPCCNPLRPYIVSEDARRPRRCSDEPHQQPDRRRLARPVRPQEPVDGTGRHRQVEVGERRYLAVALGQPGRLDDKLTEGKGCP